MADTLEELEARRDELLSVRHSGVRRVGYDGHEVSYATDDEMRVALADLERRIAAARGAPCVTTIRLTTSKGL